MSRAVWPMAIVLAGAFWFALSPVYYLAPFADDTRPLSLRIPAAYGMSGREVECEIRAAEMRSLRLTANARCVPVAAWRHWLNIREVKG